MEMIDYYAYALLITLPLLIAGIAIVLCTGKKIGIPLMLTPCIPSVITLLYCQNVLR